MLLMDKLDQYEMKTIKKELTPLFENDKMFGPSSISSIDRLNLEIRDSLSAFPSLNMVMDTSIILQLKAKELFEKQIKFDEMTPDVQLLKYNPGQFYNWHTDVIPQEKETNYIRIVTISLNVNDEYTGGGLEVRHKGETLKLPSEPGSYTIFPSFLSHRALPVETGCRKAVTLWIKGDTERLNMLYQLYSKQ
jgi:predicted 2-oxoglutarate/Fe(II)-dependent dioxygenase YbiX